MVLLTLKKPADVLIDRIIDFFDTEFKGMGFRQGLRTESLTHTEILYTTQQSGCVRATYSKNQPFKILSPGKIEEFDLSFEFTQMSQTYQEKLIEFITQGRIY